LGETLTAINMGWRNHLTNGVGIQLSPENTQMIATVASSLGGALTRHANHCKEYRQTKSGLSQF
jgi:hypothetical protein